MRYFFIDGSYIPKHCIYGPRPREAVFFNDWEWYEINDNLYRWDRDKQTAEMYAVKEQYKKDTSFNMTKNWQNTLASVKTQSEQRRIEKKMKEKQDKIDAYNKILENRKEERKPILASAKKALFEVKDETRTVVSALTQCAVLTERDKQVEFANFLRSEQRKREDDFAERMRQDVENFKKEEEEKRKQRIEKRNDFRRALMEQVKEKREAAEEANEKERRAEENDVAKMREAMERSRECRKKEKADGINQTRQDYEKSYHAAELEKNLALEEDEESELNRMMEKYSRRFAKEKAGKEANMLREAIEKRAKLAEALSAKLENSGRNEDEIYRKAVREIQEEESKKAREREEAREKSKKEIKEWEEIYKAKVAEERHAEREALKWTILQNEKRKEVNEAWSRELKRKLKEEKDDARDGYMKQIAEKMAAAEENRKRDSVFLAKQNEGADEIAGYCDDALTYAKTRQWRTYPLLATVARVKKDRGRIDTADQKPEAIRGPDRHNCGRPIGSFGFDCYCFKN